MRNALRYAVVSAAGLLCGVMLFFPWNSVADTAAAVLTKTAAGRGVYVTVDSTSAYGVFSKSFSYGGVGIDLPMAKVNLREVTVTPSILSSLFSGEKRARLTFGRGSVLPVTRQELAWNSGSADVTVTDRSFLLENISFAGKTAVTGYAEISRANLKLTKARLLVKVPEELDRMLELARMANMLPLTKIKNGEWRIER